MPCTVWLCDQLCHWINHYVLNGCLLPSFVAFACCLPPLTMLGLCSGNAAVASLWYQLLPAQCFLLETTVWCLMCLGHRSTGLKRCDISSTPGPTTENLAIMCYLIVQEEPNFSWNCCQVRVTLWKLVVFQERIGSWGMTVKGEKLNPHGEVCTLPGL